MKPPVEALDERAAVRASDSTAPRSVSNSAPFSHADTVSRLTPKRSLKAFIATVSPLHLTCRANHSVIARALLDHGADPSIHDSKHDGSARDWAQFFKRAEIAQMLEHQSAG